jgi:4'-phosphopantetheinyl transferase
VRRGDGRFRVGVDVENLGRPAPVEIAESSFSPSEALALRALPVASQQRRFFQYWTLKEAYIKARGVGLAIPLKQFAFILGPTSSIHVSFDSALADDSAWWQFWQFEPLRDYLAAVAVRRCPGMDLDLVIRRASLSETERR